MQLVVKQSQPLRNDNNWFMFLYNSLTRKKEKLSKIAQSCGIPSKTEKSIKLALQKISKDDDGATIFCTGSLYFAGEILSLN